jgi:hypothetical protein
MGVKLAGVFDLHEVDDLLQEGADGRKREQKAKNEFHDPSELIVISNIRNNSEALHKPYLTTEAQCEQ